MLGRLRSAWGDLAAWERWVLLGALGVGAALRIGYVLASLDIGLAGDENYYHGSALLHDQGHWWWTTVPYGEPHASLQKAPIYPAWVGIWYSIAGTDPDYVRLAQAVVSLSTIVLAWLLARRLFGPVAAAVTAAVLAVYPNAWQFDVRLFSESLATPATLLALLVVFTRPPTPRTAALAGAAVGLNLLIRPSAMLLFAGAAVLWWASAGLRRGAVLTATAVGVAALVVVPWTIRNLSVDSEHLIPISAQDQAAYGTFNDDAANDEDLPYKWRAVPSRDRALLRGRGERLSDGDLRAELQSRVREYISEHPDAVPKAFFYNGLVRLWDLRPPSQVTGDARVGNRNRTLTAIGLALYWPLLALALVALWRAWRGGRRPLVLAVLALALAASVVYTSDSGTRYRAPLEPLIVVLASSVIAAALPGSARRLGHEGPDRGAPA